MTKHEIKRAMFFNLKKQLNAQKLLDTCQEANETASVRFYEGEISELEKQLNELYAQYENCISD